LATLAGGFLGLVKGKSIYENPKTTETISAVNINNILPHTCSIGEDIH
jgi:hypothetical protein